MHNCWFCSLLNFATSTPPPHSAPPPRLVPVHECRKAVGVSSSCCDIVFIARICPRPHRTSQLTPCCDLADLLPNCASQTPCTGSSIQWQAAVSQRRPPCLKKRACVPMSAPPLLLSVRSCPPKSNSKLCVGPAVAPITLLHPCRAAAACIAMAAPNGAHSFVLLQVEMENGGKTKPRNAPQRPRNAA